jgi:hypothetical protein
MLAFIKKFLQLFEIWWFQNLFDCSDIVKWFMQNFRTKCHIGSFKFFKVPRYMSQK